MNKKIIVIVEDSKILSAAVLIGELRMAVTVQNMNW